MATDLAIIEPIQPPDGRQWHLFPVALGAAAGEVEMSVPKDRYGVYGASAMAVQSDLDVTELRQRVTTKGGTTEAAMERLNAGHFEELIDAAIAAATRRGQELAENGAHT